MVQYKGSTKKRVETPGSNQASISHKDGYAESVSNTQTEGSNQSEKGPTGNFSCVPGSQISHLNRLVQAVSSWAEKIEQDDQPNSQMLKMRLILSHLAHLPLLIVLLNSQTLFYLMHLITPLFCRRDKSDHNQPIHPKCQPTGAGCCAPATKQPSRGPKTNWLKSCRLQEMCRLTGLTKKQVREWFKQRRKRDNPVDPLVNAHEGPQFACNNIQSTSFTVDDFLEGIFQRGCVPTIPDGWKKLSEETKVDVATLYQWFNQRFQFHQRAQQKAGRTTQKQWQKQIEGVLEKQFQHSPILNPLKKEYLCQKSGWTEAMIISWFMQRNQKKWNEDRNHTFNPFSLNYLENKFRNNNQADKMDMEEMKCLTGADPSQILLWFETRRSHEHMKMPTKQMPRAIDANAFADFMARCNEAAGPSATLQHPNQVQPQGFAQQQGPFNFQPQHCTSNSLNFMQYMQQIPWSSEQDVAGRLSAPKQRRQKI
uniref:Homeobox domain-containing protein n=1 Tax=Ditylenchus dipsaci TaxID=166011 RepID=A0A915EL76_9BILA